jgi:hypothetical protein
MRRVSQMKANSTANIACEMNDDNMLIGCSLNLNEQARKAICLIEKYRNKMVNLTVKK